MDSNIRKQRANIHQIVQPKLTVGQPNDKYEQEADSVADRIVAKQPIPAISSISSPDFSTGSQPGAAIQQAAAENVDEHRKEDKKVQRQEEDKKEKAVQAKLIQLKAKEEEKPVQAKLIQLKAKEEEKPVQAELLQRKAKEEEKPVQAELLQRKAKEEEKPVQAELLQRKAKEEEEKPVQAKLLQLKAKEGEEKPVQAELLQRKAKEEEKPVQAELLQRKAKEEEKPVQAKLLQRKGMEEEKKPVQAKKAAEEDKQIQAMGAIPSSEAASRALAGGASGSALRPEVRSTLESGLGADLSQVRVHEDSASHAAAASINAKAFTHKNEIWLGAGQSQADLRLMAHETAHVVQQGGGVQSASSAISPAAPKVQRWWNPIAAVAEVVSDAVEWVGESIGDAVNYIKEKARDFVSNMPGYSLFAVVIGCDPITGQNVDRTGRNFIEAGLDIIPGGGALKQKLEEQGALEEAAQWLDGQIKVLDVSPAEIGAQLSAFWAGLTLADATRLPTVLDRLISIIQGPVERIIRFATTVAAKLLQIVKDYLISSLINFVKEQTTAYPLLTLILGRDPISGATVERTPMALLRAFMQLSESGAEQLRQMEESGSLQRAAAWLDGAVTRLNLSWQELVNGFMGIWNSVGIESLLDPGGVFQQIYQTFAAPVGRIIDFLIEVGTMVLKLIKDALISRLIDFARTIRGYPLLTVILGKDPFSDAPVERSAENIIHGFMCLMDGGEQQFQEMQQTGAIASLTTRIENAIATLNFTWEYIKGLFISAWESFSLSDLAAPFAAFGRLMGIFAEPLGRLISFVGEVIRLVIEVALKLMNFPVALISNIISKAMQAFDDIKRDPIGFLKNLLRAVKTGFVKFFANIATHLLNGVTGWLFKELQDAGISPPTDFSLKGILGFVLDVLGITVDKVLNKVFKKLVEKIGQEKVDRIRGMIDKLTGVWAFVSDVMTRGPVAIWEYIQDQLSNLWDVVLDAVRNWVVTKIIEKITVKLISMLDPTGIMAVVNGFIAFYSAIQSFIAYLREMLEIVNSFVEGVAEIARGSVESAGAFLEGALARGVPVVIGFLANQVGLGGLGRKIGEMIAKVREMVDKAIDWLIDKAMGAVEALLKMGKGVIAKIRDWWKIKEKVTTKDGEKHTIKFDGTGSEAKLIIRSDPKPYSEYLNDLKDKKAVVVDDKYTAALDQSKLVEELVKQHKSISDEQQKAEIAKQIETGTKKLAELTKELNITSGGGNTEPVYGSPTGGGYGTFAKVASLKKTYPTGTEAGEIFTGDYRDLNARRQGNRAFYVRGHLLSWRLGGPGNDWKNLTPLFQNVNSKHRSRFENFVINSNEAKNFEVAATYGRSERAMPASVVVDGKKTQSGQLSDVNREKVRNILKAETQVPEKIVCKADNVPGLSGPIDINNNIDEQPLEITG